MESSPSVPLDAAELLTALACHDVDCVLIGGTAMQVHGHVRTTQDVDVVAAWTVENMRALAATLDEIGARLRGVDADLLGIDLADPRQLHEGGSFMMHTRFGDLDVFAADQTAGAEGCDSGAAVRPCQRRARCCAQGLSVRPKNVSRLRPT